MDYTSERLIKGELKFTQMQTREDMMCMKDQPLDITHLCGEARCNL